MKNLKLAFISAALTTLSAMSPAQIIIGPGHWVSYLANYVTNPGFESGLSNWNTSQSYFEGDELVYEPLCAVTKDPHSGTYGLNMELGYSYGYNGFYHAEMSQTLSTPVAVSSLTYGYIYAQAENNYLNMTVMYTDGTGTSADFNVDSSNAPQGANGWVEWNFLSLLKAGKTIKSIDFNANSYDGGPIQLDDVMLGQLSWFYIP